MQSTERKRERERERDSVAESPRYRLHLVNRAGKARDQEQYPDCELKKKKKKEEKMKEVPCKVIVSGEKRLLLVKETRRTDFAKPRVPEKS